MGRSRRQQHRRVRSQGLAGRLRLSGMTTRHGGLGQGSFCGELSRVGLDSCALGLPGLGRPMLGWCRGPALHLPSPVSLCVTIRGFSCHVLAGRRHARWVMNHLGLMNRDLNPRGVECHDWSAVAMPAGNCIIPG